MCACIVTWISPICNSSNVCCCSYSWLLLIIYVYITSQHIRYIRLIFEQYSLYLPLLFLPCRLWTIQLGKRNIYAIVTPSFDSLRKLELASFIVWWSIEMSATIIQKAMKLRVGLCQMLVSGVWICCVWSNIYRIRWKIWKRLERWLLKLYRKEPSWSYSPSALTGIPLINCAKYVVPMTRSFSGKILRKYLQFFNCLLFTYRKYQW